MSDIKIGREIRHEEFRRLVIGLEPEILEAARVGVGFRDETRAQMPVRFSHLSLRQSIKNGVAGKVAVVLHADRLKKDGTPAKTGEHFWEIPENKDWLWNIKRTFTAEGIERLFELREFALKEWGAIDWEKVEAR